MPAVVFLRADSGQRRWIPDLHYDVALSTRYAHAARDGAMQMLREARRGKGNNKYVALKGRGVCRLSQTVGSLK